MSDYNFVQNGNYIDHSVAGNGTAIEAGDVVVIEDMIGVAMTDIGQGETGSVALCGVFELPKTNAAITKGQVLNWDASYNSNSGGFTEAATAAAGDVSGGGKAFASAAATATTAKVLLTNLG